MQVLNLIETAVVGVLLACGVFTYAASIYTDWQYESTSSTPVVFVYLLGNYTTKTLGLAVLACAFWLCIVGK